MYTMEVKVSSLEEFDKCLGDLGTEERCSGGQNRDLSFRGQADREWSVESTLFRRLTHVTSVKDYYRAVLRSRFMFETLTDERWEMPDIDDLFRAMQDYDEGGRWLENGLKDGGLLLFLRHHGFPSKIVDWSRSPYIAAFFAFREPVKTDPAVCILRLSNTGDVRMPDKAVMYRIGEHITTHKRHYLQQSEYTMCAKFSQQKRCWLFVSHDEVISEPEGTEHQLTKVVFAREMRLSLLKRLDQYNLNTFSLFGSAESLSETAAFRAFDNALGWH